MSNSTNGDEKTRFKPIEHSIALAAVIVAIVGLWASWSSAKSAERLAANAQEAADKAYEKETERLREQQIHNHRTELSKLLRQSYGDRALALSMVSGMRMFAGLIGGPVEDDTSAGIQIGASKGHLAYVQGNEVLMRQAISLLNKLPKDDRMPADYLAIAIGLYHSGHLDESLEYADDGLASSPEKSIRLQLIVQKARIHYSLADRKSGEALFKEAIEVSEQFKRKIERDSILALTEIVRADYELGADELELARKLLDSARDRVKDMPNRTLELRDHVENLASAVETKLKRKLMQVAMNEQAGDAPDTVPVFEERHGLFEKHTENGETVYRRVNVFQPAGTVHKRFIGKVSHDFGQSSSNGVGVVEPPPPVVPPSDES